MKRSLIVAMAALLGGCGGSSGNSPLSASNINLIFVVSSDLAYNASGDIDPNTANLTEYQNPKSETNPNDFKLKCSKQVTLLVETECFEFWLFEIRICFEFRASDFEFPAFLTTFGEKCELRIQYSGAVVYHVMNRELNEYGPLWERTQIEIQNAKRKT